MSNYVLLVPDDWGHIVIRATNGAYRSTDGEVSVSEKDLVELLDAGFLFKDPALNFLMKAARGVRVTPLVNNYTLSSGSPGDLLKNAGTSNLTVTLPKNPSIEEGTIITLVRTNTGSLTLVAASGVTLTGATAVGSNGIAQVLYLGNNDWLAFGALS